ncbi:MAG: TIGR03619 family F420-dependent LLM class oxidoreductase [Actinomycetota bacterium]
MPEHSHIPASRETPWPGSPDGSAPLPDMYWHLNDQVVGLAMAAAVTTDLVLGTAVTLVAQHDPIWLAKQLATLDSLSGGRLRLGVGFGWNREQGDQHGVPFAERRQLTEDHLGIMRALWSDEEAEYAGALRSLAPSWAHPKPAQVGGPPVLLGGGWGPVLFDAITRYGDGWMPISARSSIRDRLDPLRRRFEEAGRDPDGIQVAIMGATTDPSGLLALGDEGVQRAILTVWSEDRDEILRTLDDYQQVKDRVLGAT